MKSFPVFAWVHLGPNRIPRYLRKNIQRTSEIFPNAKQFLVVDHKSNSQVHISRELETVFIEDSKENWSKVFANMRHDLNFRGAFWFNSMARFKALAVLMKNKELQSVTHIESDVILLKNFPVHTFPKLSGKLAYAFESPKQGIASVLYVGSYDSILDLVDFCEVQVQYDSKLTDMTALALYREKYPDKVQILPTIPDLQKIHWNEKDREFSVNTKTFSGLFDGISLGQYLFGVDPRNNRGFRKLYWHDPNHLFDPRDVRYRWADGRLYMIDSHQQYEIFNLHIHSKDLRAFDSRKLEKLIQKRLTQIQTYPKYEIDFLAFTKAFLRSFIRRLKAKL